MVCLVGKSTFCHVCPRFFIPWPSASRLAQQVTTVLVHVLGHRTTCATLSYVPSAAAACAHTASSGRSPRPAATACASRSMLAWASAAVQARAAVAAASPPPPAAPSPPHPRGFCTSHCGVPPPAAAKTTTPGASGAGDSVAPPLSAGAGSGAACALFAPGARPRRVSSGRDAGQESYPWGMRARRAAHRANCVTSARTAGQSQSSPSRTPPLRGAQEAPDQCVRQRVGQRQPSSSRARTAPGVQTPSGSRRGSRPPRAPSPDR
jgi:hypothetical protein